MPNASATTVKKNSIETHAKILGVTSFRSGSTPRARMASICSVTTIDPSSLAIDDAFRPATMIPVSTGPSSRIIVRLTNRPVTAVAPNSESVAADCSASTPPVKKPESSTMLVEPRRSRRTGSETPASRSACSTDS